MQSYPERRCAQKEVTVFAVGSCRSTVVNLKSVLLPVSIERNDELIVVEAELCLSTLSLLIDLVHHEYRK